MGGTKGDAAGLVSCEKETRRKGRRREGRTPAWNFEEVDLDSYDDQVFGEELLAEISGAGPSLASLAPLIEPLLDSKMPAFRAAAARALGALGDPAQRGSAAPRGA